MDREQLNNEIEDSVTDPVDRLIKEKKPPSPGKGIAILALLLALAAVGESGWRWWLDRVAGTTESTQQQTVAQLQTAQQRLSGSVESFQSQLDAIDSAVDPAEFAQLAKRVSGVENTAAGLRGQTNEDKASVSAVQGSVRSMQLRLSAVESGLTSVAAKNQNSSIELEIAEIDFLLRAANERLQLFSDPNAADLALQAADFQLEALNDPMFLSVRQRIASSRQALAGVPRIDRVDLSARLSDLQAKVPGLAFHGETHEEPEPELPADAGWWASLKHTLGSLVTVRRRVPEDQSLLSLEDKDYLRQGLWLQLESARLALMRNDATVYNGSLDRVNITVEQFFEKKSPAVQALQDEVTALKQVQIAAEMPDVSAPWTQLRQLRDSRRLLQSASPVESPIPAVESSTDEDSGE